MGIDEPDCLPRKRFAHELTKRSASDSVAKLTSALSDAQVTLNPHQIEGAFRSPLSNGAILADEVGLGKTIEAGIPLAAMGRAQAVPALPGVANPFEGHTVCRLGPTLVDVLLEKPA